MVALAKQLQSNISLPLDEVIHGDCLEALRSLPSNSVDAIVSDPPAGIAFMGKDWDNFSGKQKTYDSAGERAKANANKEKLKQYEQGTTPFAFSGSGMPTKKERDAFIAFMTSVMQEALRVLKPGGYGLIWALPRTSHWTALALEDAGFIVKDCVSHIAGSGFPKSLDVRKSAIKAGLACNCQKSVLYSHYEDMHSMRQGMDAAQPISGNSQLDLQQRMQWQAHQCDEERQAAQTSTHDDMQALWQGISTDQWTQDSALLQLPVCSTAPDTKPAIYRASQEDSAKHEGQARNAAIWSEQSSVEGRRDAQESTWQLSGREICEVSTRISSNGSQGRVRDGASASDGSTLGAVSQQNGSSPSHRPQTEQQSSQQSSTIPQQSGAQTCGRCGKAIIQEGLGSALKPACEFWWLVQKPISEKSIAANVLKWGTGGLAIDKCRVGMMTPEEIARSGKSTKGMFGLDSVDWKRSGREPQGRFPSHLLLSHSVWCVPRGVKRVRGTAPPGRPSRGQATQSIFVANNPNHPGYADPDGCEEIEDYECHESCPVRLLDEQSGMSRSVQGSNGGASKFFGVNGRSRDNGYGDQGGASRYFQTFHYFSKASRAERNQGCEGLPERDVQEYGTIRTNRGNGYEKTSVSTNSHPTVKSLSLMSWLCRLITPPGGLILDPFLGSGSTAVAAIHEGFHFIGIEQEAEYVAICEARIAHALKEVR